MKIKRSQVGTIVAGIDPSATCTGVVVAEVVEKGLRILKAVNVRPARSCRTATERIDAVASGVSGILLQTPIHDVIVEMPSAHVCARHAGGGAGLATYGRVVGRIEEIAMAAAVDHVYRPGVDDLYRGRPKSARHEGLRLAFPELRRASHDVLDAFSLIVWWAGQSMESVQK
jgi:hypothetical protein